MAKFKVLESTELIVDNVASINVKEDLDNKFHIKIDDKNDILTIGIPFDGGTYFIPYKEAIKVLQDHYICREA